ncbi:MAG: GtrA family protein [Candidatus Bathyarchaeia archaeon]
MKLTYTGFESRYAACAKVARFLVAGATGAAIDLGLLFVLVHIFGFWYVASVTAACIVAYGASFVLQKSWTFRDRSLDRVPAQAAWYFLVTVANIGLNSLLVYLFVEKASMNYLVAQVLSSVLVAIESYFIYRRIFRSSV